jgi:hypothetical protein
MCKRILKIFEVRKYLQNKYLFNICLGIIAQRKLKKVRVINFKNSHKFEEFVDLI